MALSEYSIIFCKDCERGGSLIEDKDFGRDLKWKKKKKKASQWLYYVLSNQMVILCSGACLFFGELFWKF